jgi:hypothetical protein
MSVGLNLRLSVSRSKLHVQTAKIFRLLLESLHSDLSISRWFLVPVLLVVLHSVHRCVACVDSGKPELIPGNN